MYGWIVKRLAASAFEGLREGDARFATALLAEDVQFRFPGRHPFAAQFATKADSRQWLLRFAHFRPDFDIHDVVVGGPPWNIRACIYFTDRIGAPDDGSAYVNEGICFLRLRRGRVVEGRIFLDTQAVAEFFGTETPEEFFADLITADAPADVSDRSRCPIDAAIRRS